MVFGMVSPRGDESGLSRPDPAGLILRSCTLPAGLPMRMDPIWLIVMLRGVAPLLGVLLPGNHKKDAVTLMENTVFLLES